MIKVHLHVMLPPALKLEILRLAKRDGLSMTAVVVAILWAGIRGGAKA